MCIATGQVHSFLTAGPEALKTATILVSFLPFFLIRSESYSFDIICGCFGVMKRVGWHARFLGGSFEEMKANSHIEVHFIGEDTCSVRCTPTHSGREELLSEIAGFTFFAIRMISNLGSHEVTYSLLVGLGAAGRSIDAGYLNVIPENLEVVEFSGSIGPKRFIANLHYEDSAVRFSFSAKGFGLLARGVGYYGPMAVFALLHYLTSARPTDRQYLLSLASVARRLGSIHEPLTMPKAEQDNLATAFITAAAAFI